MQINLPTGARVTVSVPRGPAVTVAPPPSRNVVVVPKAGPPGPPGRNGDGADLIHVQATPSASWSFPSTLGRMPTAVTVWNADGEVIEADVECTTSQIVITFAAPAVGAVTWR